MWRSPSPDSSATSSWCRSTACRCIAGWTSARPNPRAAEQVEVRHHCIDLVEPTAEFTVGDFQPAYRLEPSTSIGDRGRRALLVGGTGLYHRVVIDDFELPGEFPDVRAGLEGRRRHVGSPCCASPSWTRQPPRRWSRAIVAEWSGRSRSPSGPVDPSAVSVPGVDSYPPTPVVQVGLRRPRALLAQRIERRVHSMIAAGLIDEVERLMVGRILTIRRSSAGVQGNRRAPGGAYRQG